MNLIYFLDAVDTCHDVAASRIGEIIRTIYTTIQWGVPLILIIVGMVGMGKAIAQQKEDDIKKAQSTLVKQAVAALIVLLMAVGVKIGVKAIGSDDSASCIDMMLNKTCVDGGKKGTLTEGADDVWSCATKSS